MNHLRNTVASFLTLVALCLLTACGGAGKASHPDESAITTFLNRYFSTWSAQDMEGYGGCFSPLARITFTAGQDRMQSTGLTDFLHSQKMSHASATTPMTEIPTSMDITGDNRVAQAEVRWRLTKGAEITTGTDYFTLVKTSEGWRIISLVFYND